MRHRSHENPSTEADLLTDPLVRLVGGHTARALDPADPRQASFLTWLAEHARASQSTDESRMLAAEAERFADAVLRRRQRDRELQGHDPVERDAGPTKVAASPSAPGISVQELRLVSVPPWECTPRAEGFLTNVVEVAARHRCAPVLDLEIAAGEGRDLWEQPCDRWVELPPDLPRGRYLAVGVSGESMEPLLRDGGMILVRLGPRLVPGSIIVAHRPEHGYVVKQVGRTTAREVELRSLNPAFEPVSVRRRRGTVLGTVVFHWRA